VGGIKSNLGMGEGEIGGGGGVLRGGEYKIKGAEKPFKSNCQDGFVERGPDSEPRQGGGEWGGRGAGG